MELKKDREDINYYYNLVLWRINHHNVAIKDLVDVRNKIENEDFKCRQGAFKFWSDESKTTLFAIKVTEQKTEKLIKDIKTFVEKTLNIEHDFDIEELGNKKKELLSYLKEGLPKLEKELKSLKDYFQSKLED